MRYRLLDTPTGPFALTCSFAGTLGTGWVAGPNDARLADGVPDETLEPDLAQRLADYFAGIVVDFDDVPTPEAGALFFKRCWHACRAIPRGETRTYGQLAIMAGGRAGSARVAGQAMRHNPLPIIVPCHRVLAAGRRLGGFSGNDDPASAAVRIKRWLLANEGRTAGVNQVKRGVVSAEEFEGSSTDENLFAFMRHAQGEEA